MRTYDVALVLDLGGFKSLSSGIKLLREAFSRTIILNAKRWLMLIQRINH